MKAIALAVLLVTLGGCAVVPLGPPIQVDAHARPAYGYGGEYHGGGYYGGGYYGGGYYGGGYYGRGRGR